MHRHVLAVKPRCPPGRGGSSTLSHWSVYSCRAGVVGSVCGHIFFVDEIGSRHTALRRKKKRLRIDADDPVATSQDQEVEPSVAILLGIKASVWILLSGASLICQSRALDFGVG